MKRTADQFDRLILRALCEDLAPFEAIADNLRQQLEPDELKQLSERLLRLITTGLVDSYLLHTEPPHVTPVHTDAEGIYRHWFFISESGLKHLDQLRTMHREWQSPSLPDRRSRLRCDLRASKSLGC